MPRQSLDGGIVPNSAAENALVQSAQTLINAKYATFLGQNARWQNLAGAVKFHDQATFLNNYTLTNTVPVGCQINGYTDYLHAIPTIYINRGSATQATVIHELLHYATHAQFRAAFTSRIVEGVTEYFTRKTQGRAGPADAQFVVDRTGIYDEEHNEVNQARGIIKSHIPQQTRGKDFMKRAYFQGDAQAIAVISSVMM